MAQVKGGAHHCFPDIASAERWRYLECADYEAVKGYKFSDVKDKFFKKKASELAPSTLQTYQNQAKHLAFFEKFSIRDIKTSTIDKWLDKLKSASYLSTQNSTRLTFDKELGLLSQIFTYFSDYLAGDDPYVSPIKRRHKKDCIISHERLKEQRDRYNMKYLPEEEVLKFIAELKRRSTKSRLDYLCYVVALLHYSTGARIGEICALFWEVVDLLSEQPSIFIRRTVRWSRKKGEPTTISNKTKTGISRTAYMHACVVTELKKLKLQSGKNKLVFTLDGKSPLVYRSVQHRYDEALKAIGSKYSGTHILRDSHSTNFLEATSNNRALQSQLGHTTDRQTQHYAKMTGKVKREGYSEYHKNHNELEKIVSS